MKNLGKGFIALMLSFSFIACENDQEPLMPESKLNSYKLERSEDGVVTIEYTSNDGFSAESVENITNGSLDIYFNDNNGDAELTKERLDVDSEVKVNFIGLESDRNESISVLDDDMTNLYLRGGNPLLKGYYIHKTFSGRYIVFFKVKDGVEVTYQFNEELGENEIVLMPSQGRRIFKDIHAQVYNRAYGEPLKITFMSPNASSKENTSVEDTSSNDPFDQVSFIRRPRIIIAG